MHITLSKNEYSVLEILWDSNTPLSRPEIIEKMPDKGWNPNSIHHILNNLIKKNCIKVSGMTKCGQGYGRTYFPSLTQGEYAAMQAMQAMPNIPERKRVIQIMSTLVCLDSVNEETLNELKQMVIERQHQISKDNVDK